MSRLTLSITPKAFRSSLIFCGLWNWAVNSVITRVRAVLMRQHIRLKNPVGTYILFLVKSISSDFGFRVTASLAATGWVFFSVFEGVGAWEVEGFSTGGGLDFPSCENTLEPLSWKKDECTVPRLRAYSIFRVLSLNLIACNSLIALSASSPMALTKFIHNLQRSRARAGENAKNVLLNESLASAFVRSWRNDERCVINESLRRSVPFLVMTKLRLMGPIWPKKFSS